MGREDWKKTGKELGTAFGGLAKSLIRSAKDGADKVADWADGEDENTAAKAEERNVFNDGTWRETGKGIGHAMGALGKSLLNTGAEVADKVDDWVESKVEEDAAEEKNDDQQNL